MCCCYCPSPVDYFTRFFISDCGRSLAMTTRRIIHGTKTLAGEWPWVVAIAIPEGIQCGGALVNSQTVVTAAHCLTNSNSYTLYFGKFHRWDKDDDAEVMTRRVSFRVMHTVHAIKNVYTKAFPQFTFLLSLHFLLNLTTEKEK